MRRTRARSTRATVAMAVLALTGLSLTACNSGGGGGDGKDITLTVGVFGDSFPKELYDQYEKDHPGITIKEVRADYPTHHNNLQAHITAGAGASDVELIEVGQISGFLGQADKFVNFKDESGADLSQWNDAKLAQTTAPTGQVIGLPTDTGGLAICYRTDLFQAAGLPTDPAKVSQLMPTWDDYVALGKRFQQATPKVKWFDSASNLFNGILGDADETYYDASGKPVVDSNPVVKDAWDLTTGAVQDGESANLAAFSAEWNTGFQRGQFATVTCPAWMLAYIRTNAPETKGKWNIATVPGGSGNWGGSFATVPTEGKHVAQATELAEWLTDTPQAITVYKTLGNFPASQASWSSPAVADSKDAFFDNAPVGKIFPASLADAPVQPVGPQAGQIGQAMGNALNTVEQGTDPDTAWQQAMKDVSDLTAG